MLQDPQDAQDAAQDSFLKAYRGLSRFSPESSLYTWLYRIAVNTCLDYRRKSRRMRLKSEPLTEGLPSYEQSPHQLFESRQATESIQAALQKLPEKLRAAILLREMEGLTYAEMAEVLQTSVGTIRSRISRARAQLRHLLRRNTG